MHVLIIGAVSEMVEAVVSARHDVTLLYEPWEADEAAKWRSTVRHWCAVDSYASLESLWSALHHVGALADGVDVIVTPDEYAMVPVAVLGGLLGARTIDPEVALRCRDKAVQKAAWRASGIPTAKFVVIPDVALDERDVAEVVNVAGLSGRLVVKPLAGAGAKGIAIVEDEYALLKYVRSAAAHDPTMCRVVVEEFNAGSEWHFDGLLRGGHLEAIAVSRYLNPLIETKEGKAGAGVTFQPQQHPELYAEATEFTGRAVKALGHDTGAFHFEVFGGPGAFVAGELAARPGGWPIPKIVEKVLGVNLNVGAALLLTGDPLPYATPSTEFTYGYINLPTIAGRPNQLMLEQLQELPGVYEARVKLAVGEAMSDMRTDTSVRLGHALIQAPDVETCEARLEAVCERVMEINSAD
jgi:biotin carboxylase